MAATAVQYSNGEMVFYYDNNDHSLDQNYLNQYSVDNTQVTMELLEENSPSARIPKWISSSYYPYNNVTSIRFDASFKNLHSLQFYVQEKDQGYVNYGIPFLSMSGWFMNFSNVSSVTGLENVPSGIYDMRNMFYGFKNSSEMETLDLSSLDMRSVVFADYMFGNFGLLNCNIILPDNVSNNVVEDDFKKYDTNSIIYCYMFNGSSALNNVTFGQSFGNTELPCNLMCMFNNCIQLKSAELTTINNLGQKECNVDHMFNGCIGLSSMLIDTHIPHNEISMSYLGILDANWLDANGQHYSIKDPMENNLLYSAKGLINIHFGNYVAASSGGGFNEPGNYSLDLNVVPGVHMEFDSREMKFYLSHENVKSEEPMCEIQLYLNSPYEFDHVEGIPEKTISHDTNITVYYNLGGQILKTAKLVKTSVGKYGSNYTFYYDALTETDYKNKFGDDFQDFWYVKNTFDTDKPE